MAIYSEFSQLKMVDLSIVFVGLPEGIMDFSGLFFRPFQVREYISRESKA